MTRSIEFLNNVKVYLSLTTRHLYKGSMFEVLNSQRFEYRVRKAQENTQIQSYYQQIVKTIKFTVHNYINVSCVIVGLNFILPKLMKDTNNSCELVNESFMLIVVALPIIEEIIFRGILQKSLQLIPIITPSMRIMATTCFFSHVTFI